MKHMPTEILVLIFSNLRLTLFPSCVSKHDPFERKEDDTQRENERLKFKTLRNLCVVCRSFHDICTPLLYHTADLSFGDVGNAYRLLRQLVLNPERRHSVRAMITLHISEDLYCLFRTSDVPRLHTFTRDSTQRLERPEEMKDEFFNKFRDLLDYSSLFEDACFLGGHTQDPELYNRSIAIILLICPNLKLITLQQFNTAGSSVITDVLRSHNVSRRSILPQLQEVRCCGGVALPSSYRVGIADPLQIFEVPTLQTLHCHYLCLSFYFDSGALGSNLKHLYLTQPSLDPNGFQHILEFCQQLRTLSIEITPTPHRARQGSQFKPSIDRIGQYGTALETLIVAASGSTAIGSYLKDLTSLRTLVLPMSAFDPETLSYHSWDGLFTERLPTSLEYLKVIIYPCDSDEKESKRELRRLLEDPRYGKLKHLEWTNSDKSNGMVWRYSGEKLGFWRTGVRY